MPQFEKLLQRISSLDKNMRFDELKKVLERLGYSMTPSGSGGSHMTFRKKGRFPITIPKNNPIKVAYVELVKRKIEEEESNDKES